MYKFTAKSAAVTAPASGQRPAALHLHAASAEGVVVRAAAEGTLQVVATIEP